MMKPLALLACLLATVASLALGSAAASQGGTKSGAPIRIALVKQPFIPNGTSVGPTTMASGGIQAELAKLGATVRVNEVALTKEQEPEYGGWKRLGFALGHLQRDDARRR